MDIFSASAPVFCLGCSELDPGLVSSRYCFFACWVSSLLDYCFWFSAGRLAGFLLAGPLAEPTCKKIPNLFSVSLNKDIYAAECWCTATHSWNLGLRRNMLDNEITNVASVLEILHSWAPTEGNDSLK